MIPDSPPSYWYEGRCPQQSIMLRLPRTAMVEAIANGLMTDLSRDPRYSSEGKMYGVLLIETLAKKLGVIKAFSGLLNGNSQVKGWVPPIPGRDQVILPEIYTLTQLENIKQKIIYLQSLEVWQSYDKLTQEWQTNFAHLAVVHLQRKQQRQQQREILCKTLTGDSLAIAIEQLNVASRHDKREKKQLKQQRDQILKPLKEVIELAQQEITQLKQQRQELSRKLQSQMNAVYTLTNFAGNSTSLQQLKTKGLPTGTGDCCAPKLLHYAAINQLKPLAMAEFWWGPVKGDKVPGEFYGACESRCQPLMGFLLSGLSSIPLVNNSKLQDLSIIYEDQYLIAVNKPTGLLSVPGRYRDRQDSVLSRLQNLLPDGINLRAIHRLDQDTSGIILLARNLDIYRQLSQQFEQRQVKKVYEAILEDLLLIDQGIIELPLWGDPSDRPYQKVNFAQGKPSITQFRVISREGNYTRIELIPLTGRTHQLRVHCSDKKGLGIPILGDRLYGNLTDTNRLYLQAKELYFYHPQLGKSINLRVEEEF
ncbi:pseudouridine synthase [Aphanothece sacrum]|nr:pseudouridine synthase [Aphanothece sacrum]GBF83720.1 ribosomal large subunit pseudouridine synthase [Aphanothece sacrum FPU3]